jgi:serine/threonine-protein kinase RsbW
LKVESHPANLAAVRKQVESLAAAHGFSAKAVAEIGLCVNEAMANVIRHAYDNRHDRPIELTADVDERDGGWITITIRDWGSGVDPSCCPPRPYDPLEPGGVGMICLRQWLDEVRYDRQPGGGMLTTMRKKKS